ncbi:lipase family protein [Clostridium aminobutyricum]|uniref:Lipase family protein n=1 Tax=Clostridium aminobutyricum TaxID=33953 RepID=A0A939II33_CLOAM|nr:lipase family protein [Clostridium aminobutyricum]MBN7774507.1 lipase family protein [Clostridium aminobutyricum]
MRRKILCLSFVLLLLMTLTRFPLSQNEAFAASTLSKDVTILGPNGEDTTIEKVTYSDSFFSDDSSNYGQGPAALSLAFSTAAYGSTPSFIENALSAFGFTNDSIYDSDSYQASAKEGHDAVGYSFASKKIKVNNKEYTLVAVVIRGTSGDNEWISNFNINNSGDNPFVHEGFSLAEKSLLVHLNQYAESLHLNRATTKFLITGHSRGAAVANLLAADLSETEQLADQSNIYGYTFATPNVAKINENNYPNIFNGVNPADIITQIPLEKWGYSKYGVTYSLPEESKIQAESLAASQKLLSDLESMAPTIQDFYNDNLALILLHGDFIKKSVTEMHYPATYLYWLDQADPNKLSEQILEIQLKMIPDKTYA